MHPGSFERLVPVSGFLTSAVSYPCLSGTSCIDSLHEIDFVKHALGCLQSWAAEQGQLPADSAAGAGEACGGLQHGEDGPRVPNAGQQQGRVPGRGGAQARLAGDPQPRVRCSDHQRRLQVEKI